MTFLRQATTNGHRRAFGLHLDVASFFPSIGKDTLYDLIARRIADPEVRWLLRTVLFHDPITHYRFRSLHGLGHRPRPATRSPPASRSSASRTRADCRSAT